MTAARERLPNLRGAIVSEFAHRDLKYRAHVGFFLDGKPAEIFLTRTSRVIGAAVDKLAELTPTGGYLLP
jgi:hypothetical protein